jgi:N-acetyl-gamma-glutamyl-phosphate reductase
MSKIKAAIVGASGYTGAELVRLLIRHPNVEILAMTADRKAGLSMGEVFPHLAGLGLSELISLDRLDYTGIDVVFCGLPHGSTQKVISKMPEHLKIVDLSADFRLRDVEIYEEWYGHAHQAPKLQEDAIYGLTELARNDVKNARLVANPGCYPTSVQLPLIPLLRAGQVSSEDIIIDAKSGVKRRGWSGCYGELHTTLNANESWNTIQYLCQNGKWCNGV